MLNLKMLERLGKKLGIELVFIDEDTEMVTDNPNGKITKKTPQSYFTERFPMLKSTDKIDEEATIRRYLKRNPSLKDDKDIYALWRTIRHSSARMDELQFKFHKKSSDQSEIDLKEQFAKSREENYQAIDTLARRLFGDCGFGGTLSNHIQEYLQEAMKKGTMKPAPIFGGLKIPGSF